MILTWIHNYWEALPERFFYWGVLPLQSLSIERCSLRAFFIWNFLLSTPQQCPMYLVHGKYHGSSTLSIDQFDHLKLSTVHYTKLRSHCDLNSRLGIFIYPDWLRAISRASKESLEVVRVIRRVIATHWARNFNENNSSYIEHSAEGTSWVRWLYQVDTHLGRWESVSYYKILSIWDSQRGHHSKLQHCRPYVHIIRIDGWNRWSDYFR